MITYRTLMGMPWPRNPMTRAGTFPAAAALGAVFDATTAAPSRLRKMASAWLAWSEAQLCSLARRWRQAQGLPPVALRQWLRRRRAASGASQTPGRPPPPGG